MTPKRPTKRPPKSKSTPKTLETEIQVNKGAPSSDRNVVPTVTVNVGLPTDRPSLEWLRETATFIYTTSLQKITLEDLAEHPLFAGVVTFKALAKWSAQFNWVEMRRQNAEAWRKALVVETGRELIDFRREQLKKLRKLSRVMFDKLMPDENGELQLTINSYESMAQAFVRVFSLAEDLTQKSLDEVMPDVTAIQEVSISAPDQSESVLRTSMSVEEARIGAKAILAARRELQRKQAAQGAEGALVPTVVPRVE